MACNICCDTYNLRRLRTECSSCEFDACSSCIQTYILQSTSLGDCPNCHTSFSAEWLYASLPASFLKTKYRKHRKDILCNVDQIMRDNQDIIENKKKTIALQRDIVKLKSRLLLQQLDVEEAMKVQESIRQKEASVSWNITHFFTDVQESASSKLAVNIKCHKTGCAGYFMKTTEFSKNLECSVCSTEICEKCRDRPHEGECNTSTLQSIITIQEQTVNCPRCGVACEKISGCSQVCCLYCHTNFDYNTHQIDRGLAHNPDFLDWMKSSDFAKNAHMDLYNDSLCGVHLPNREYVMSLVGDVNSATLGEQLSEVLPKLSAFYKDIEKAESLRDTLKLDTKAENASTIVKYLDLDKYDRKKQEGKLADGIYNNMVTSQYNSQVKDLANMYYLSGRDLLRRIVLNPKGVCGILKELDTLHQLVEKHLNKLNEIYPVVFGKVKCKLVQFEVNL